MHSVFSSYVHANENRTMMERFLQPTNDPLALVSNASVQHRRVVVQDVRGRYNVNNQGDLFRETCKRKCCSWDNVDDGQNRGNRGGMINPGQAKPIKCYNCNGLGHIARECPRPKRLQDSDYFKDKMLLMQAQENGAVLDKEQSLFLAGEQVTNFDDDVDDSPKNDLALNVDHIFEADQYPIYDEVGPSHDSNTPFEVQDHDFFVDHMDEYHEYLEDNKENGVQSNVSSVQNDALMSIINEMHEEGVQQGVQSRLANKPDKVVNDSLTSKLARYKELVGEYEKRAKFELTDRERKIDEQMRIIISDRNRKETSLKSELHSVQILLSSTVGHYKSKTEEVTILKKDFKQKEDKFLEEFLDIKRLKEKVEDRLYKQDQYVQMVHMICKPKSFYDEKKKVAIGYKNPLYLTQDTREIAEITRKRMMEKMKSPLYENDRKKAETSVPKPLSALTVYPPNTPVKLVPRVLPTKSQVKINLYVLTQLFTEFDKTCKKRITPTGVIEGER
ncbi:retrovirus-related pol polyprotein from transposon TNT 1-94, partial [Tanacetum coccineum]